MPDKRNRLLSAGALIALLGITALIYAQGLPGGFVFDDKPNIVANKAIQITDLEPASLRQAWESLPRPYPANRPLSMVSFGLSHVAGGLDAAGFKIANIGIHLANGVLVYLLTIMLLQQAMKRQLLDQALSGHLIAFMTTALWLLHPIQLSSVLYVVQRMNELSAFFTFAGLIFYLLGRTARSGLAQVFFIGVLLPATMFLGFHAKENAALLPLLCLLVEWLFFGFITRTKAEHSLLLVFFTVFIAIPALYTAYFLWNNPNFFTAGYNTRSFDVFERLMTEARALWFYLQLLLLPDLKVMSLYHDDFVISRGLITPWTTLFAIIGLVMLGAIAWFARSRWMPLSFAILFFFAGHLMESTVIALEPVFEHRNYLPSFGIFFAAGCVVASLQHRRGRLIFNSLVIVAMVAVAAQTLQRARIWSQEDLLTLHLVENQPESSRANFQAGVTLMKLLYKAPPNPAIYQNAEVYFTRAIQGNPDNIDGLFGLMALNLYAGQKPSAETVDELVRRLETVSLNPLNVSEQQFEYFTKLQIKSKRRLDDATYLRVMKAALPNPTLSRRTRAGIHVLLSAYYDRRAKQPDSALEHATLAVKYWPDNSEYQQQYRKLKQKYGHAKR